MFVFVKFKIKDVTENIRVIADSFPDEALFDHITFRPTQTCAMVPLIYIILTKKMKSKHTEQNYLTVSDCTYILYKKILRRWPLCQ